MTTTTEPKAAGTKAARKTGKKAAQGGVAAILKRLEAELKDLEQRRETANLERQASAREYDRAREDFKAWKREAIKTGMPPLEERQRLRSKVTEAHAESFDAEDTLALLDDLLLAKRNEVLEAKVASLQEEIRAEDDAISGQMADAFSKHAESLARFAAIGERYQARGRALSRLRDVANERWGRESQERRRLDSEVGVPPLGYLMGHRLNMIGTARAAAFLPRAVAKVLLIGVDGATLMRTRDVGAAHRAYVAKQGRDVSAEDAEAAAGIDLGGGEGSDNGEA